MKRKLSKSLFKVEKIDLSEYVHLYNNVSIKNRTITQSPGYLLDNNLSEYLKIYYKDTLICLATVSIKKLLKGLIKIGRISNGPLLIDCKVNYSKKNLIKSIFRFCKINGLKIISISPSLSFNQNDITSHFFTFKLNRIPWGSISIDLNKTEQELKKSLKSNWRNKVKKGSRLCNIKQINDKDDINQILKNYKTFSNKLNFEPIPLYKCYEWSENYLNKNNKLINLKIFSSFTNDNLKEELGSIGIVNFGETSFYLFVQTNKLGRKYAANTFMLWNAILDSKNCGYKIFDLGGYNENTTKGIKEFKNGLGGDKYQITGEYIHIEVF